MKEAFLIYKSFYEPIEFLSDEKLGLLFRAIFLYQIKNEEPEKNSVIYPSFQFFKNQFRLDEKKYNEKCLKNKDNILKRWGNNTNEYDRIGMNTKHTDKEKDNEKDKEKDNDKKNKTKIFIPPLIEEVKLYFIENGYSEAAAQKAFNYYSVANWKDSKGNQVKNWKQKMQGVWFKEENKQETKPNFKEFPR